MGTVMGRDYGGRRGINLLTHKQVQTAGQGMLHDGGGLYLQVTATGRSWILRYSLHGRRRDMGLGSLRDISLADARRLAAAARASARAGQDPILLRSQEPGRVPCVSEAVDAYIKAHKPEWSNPKHADQWQNTLDAYVKPTLGDVQVDQLTVSSVLEVLRPLWYKKTETATRVRQRLEAVIDSVYVAHDIDKRNPATWRGVLDKLLPKPRKVTEVQHFDAMPYTDVPAFMQALTARPSITARMLEFTILTAARTGMVRGALRCEFSGDVWAVPAARMKGRRQFDVSLSEAAQRIVRSIPEDGPVVFQSWKGEMSENAMLALLKHMGHGDVTVHGFRSAFRDWAGNETSFAREVIEEAMAHQIKDKAEAAYRRGSALVKRKKLMEEWAEYLAA